jgi:hypothetical protein
MRYFRTTARVTHVGGRRLNERRGGRRVYPTASGRARPVRMEA